MPKNYYIILGIPTDSSQADIKSAYRRLAKEFHPDYYGESSPFLNIQEAYSVLSDPIQRRKYDNTMQGEGKSRTQPVHVEPLREATYSREAEPLIPQNAPTHPTGLSPVRSFHSYQPSLDSLIDRWLRNFTETPHPKGKRLENLTVVVRLTPEQALRGGHVRLTVPARMRCHRCNGWGRIGPYECWRCGGQGVFSGEYPIMISYPSGIVDKHSMQLSLEPYGIRNLYLTVHFRISEDR